MNRQIYIGPVGTEPARPARDCTQSMGRPSHKATGDRLFYFERKLETLLFSPIPDPTTSESVGVELKMDQLE